MKRILAIGLFLLLTAASIARSDVIDYGDAAIFKDLGANSGYGNCTIVTVANPTDGASYVTRSCVTGATCPAAGCQGFHVPFLWPPSASVSAGTCTFQIDALNPSVDTNTTGWGVEVACCSGTTSCVNKTYGTQQTMTLTNTAVAVNRLITAVNGTGAAPASYTGLAAGNWCDFRVARLTTGTHPDGTAVEILAGHVNCQ